MLQVIKEDEVVVYDYPKDINKHNYKYSKCQLDNKEGDNEMQGKKKIHNHILNNIQ